MLITKKCIVCGKTFTTTGRCAKFCSEKCKNSKIPINEHIGERYGELEITAMYRQNGTKYAECKCSCDKICTVEYGNLLTGNTKSCGHLRDKYYSFRAKNLNGKVNKYGVKALYCSDKKNNRYKWRCLCPCGKEFDVFAARFDETMSCGCAQKVTLQKLNNVRQNARQDGTYIYSIQNKKMLKNNKSGVRGVCWDKRRNKWNAYIQFKGEKYNLGFFNTIEEAASVRKVAEEKLFGSFLEWFANEFPERWEKIKQKNLSKKT